MIEIMLGIGILVIGFPLLMISKFLEKILYELELHSSIVEEGNEKSRELIRIHKGIKNKLK
jgi:hypothetical protein